MSATLVIYAAETTAEEFETRFRKERPDTLIIVSSARVYGATPRHDLCLDENTRVEQEPGDEERANCIAVETAAHERVARRKKPCRLVILRPVHVLGGPHEGPLARALHSQQLRTAFGYDPLMQVIHHDDVEHAIELASQNDVEGVFNVCGSGALPLSELARITGTERISGIDGIVFDLLERVELRTPAHLPEDETCYFIHVDDRRFREATGYAPGLSLPQTVGALGVVASP